ncbi:MAG: AI-2E family transporter, partial [Lachnospiraceae bacterium]|nr:AI-2E family transporter [Lachnospiraceae bacterium]
GVLAVLGVGLFFLGRMAMEQLARLGEQLPTLWADCCGWLWDRCGQVEQRLHLTEGTISAQLSRMIGADGRMDSPARNQMGDQMAELWGNFLGTSLQGAVSVLKIAVSCLVTIFITIGATIITTTQLEELKCSLDRSLFRREIRQVIDTLTRVGTAYGKTQLVIMLCTVVISAVGLTILGDPYAFLWALVIGLVDALPIFGAGTILWPWLVLSAIKGQLVRTIGLAVIYAVSNLVRQWLEARYMGDRIGLSALENLIAMYLGLQLFGILGLFWGPIGYLLVKESQRNAGTTGNRETEIDKI